MIHTVRWPVSMTMQTIVSAAVALLASGFVFSQIVMGDFNRFYFGQRVQRYRTAHDADWALYSRSALAFFITFSLTLGLQRLLTRRNHPQHQAE